MGVASLGVASLGVASLGGGIVNPRVFLGTPPELAPERVGGASSGWLAKLMPPRIYTVIIVGGLSYAGEATHLFLGLATLGVAREAYASPEYTQ